LPAAIGLKNRAMRKALPELGNSLDAGVLPDRGEEGEKEWPGQNSSAIGGSYTVEL
jgi:hypothetical protein